MRTCSFSSALIAIEELMAILAAGGVFSNIPLRLGARDGRGRRSAATTPIRIRASAPRLLRLDLPRRLGPRARRLRLGFMLELGDAADRGDSASGSAGGHARSRYACRPVEHRWGSRYRSRRVPSAETIASAFAARAGLVSTSTRDSLGGDPPFAGLSLLPSPASTSTTHDGSHYVQKVDQRSKSGGRQTSEGGRQTSESEADVSEI